MRASNRGFTLVELLVVIAIIGILVALLLPAVQAARAAARKAECQNNMKQLALAAHNFEDHYRKFPTYWGGFPQIGNGAVEGSWFVHLLPYLEQANVWDGIAEGGGGMGTQPVTVITPAVWNPPVNYVPAVTQTTDNGGIWIPPVWGTRLATGTTHVGHTYQYMETYLVSGNYWGGTGIPPSTVTITPASGTPGYWTPAVQSSNGYRGIYANSDVVFKGLRCPSDNSFPATKPTITWSATNNRPWSFTNYQANFHALTNDGQTASTGTTSTTSTSISTTYFAPKDPANLTDGLSNTILFGEGMRFCDGAYRFAFWSSYKQLHSHNFGVDWNKVPNTFFFQSTYRPKACNNWRLQALHFGCLNVAMCDGSVRSLAPQISRKETSDPDQPFVYPDAIMGTENGVWDRLVLPTDGETIAEAF